VFLSRTTVVVITGASSGIGRALAIALARRGVRLALLARRAELLEDVARECRETGSDALAIACDVTSREQLTAAIDATVAQYGHLDVLVNNAGRGHNAYIEDTPDEQIESVFRVNVFSLFYGAAAALRHMRPRGAGMIVTIASIAGKIGYPGNAAYVAAKHAAVGFSRALRAEVAETGIEVMTVIPGGVVTEWAVVAEGGSMLELFAYENERGREIAAERGITLPPSIPVLPAEEVAAAIVGAIEHPAAEVYTHPGLADFVERAERAPDAFEREQLPFWLANREGYERMRRRG
jgi:short-subunit dehydrogenase